MVAALTSTALSTVPLDRIICFALLAGSYIASIFTATGCCQKRCVFFLSTTFITAEIATKVITTFVASEIATKVTAQIAAFITTKVTTQVST